MTTTRFTVTMEFEVEVQGGKVDQVLVGRAAGNYSHDVRERLTKVLQKASGRKSLCIPESGLTLGKTKCVDPGQEAPDPFLPVTAKSLGYGDDNAPHSNYGRATRAHGKK